MKNYNKQSDERYFLEADVQYPEKFHDLHNDLPFLPEKITIKKVQKFVADLHDQSEYVIHNRSKSDKKLTTHS